MKQRISRKFYIQQRRGSVWVQLSGPHTEPEAFNRFDELDDDGVYRVIVVEKHEVERKENYSGVGLFKAA